MKSRQILSDKLHALCEHVYFQPPTGFMLLYPCIIYEFTGIERRPADNIGYTTYGVYNMTYITRDPDDETKLLIAELPMCSMTRAYDSDNLYHYAYKIYN